MRNIPIKIILFFLFTFLQFGCLLRSQEYWTSETKKVESCRKKWVFKDLEKEQKAIVLLFLSKSHYSIMSFPNFIISVTEENDTIAFLDQDFSGSLKKGESVKLLPKQWSEIDKTDRTPLFTVSIKPEENDLNCSVKTVYYGKVELISVTP